MWAVYPTADLHSRQRLWSHHGSTIGNPYKLLSLLNLYCLYPGVWAVGAAMTVRFVIHIICYPWCSLIFFSLECELCILQQTYTAGSNLGAAVTVRFVLHIIYYPWCSFIVFSLECEQCILQWTYTAGNNWGKCANGTGAVGCGPQVYSLSKRSCPLVYSRLLYKNWQDSLDIRCQNRFIVLDLIKVGFDQPQKIDSNFMIFFTRGTSVWILYVQI